MDEYNIKNTQTSHEVILPIIREYDYRKLQLQQTAYFYGWSGTIPFSFISAYTPFFIDLMDSYNQAQTNTVGVFPNENVNSVSIYSIEQSVKNNPESWSGATSYLTSQNPSVATKISELSNIYSAGK